MSLLRKLTGKKDSREAPKVEAPPSVRNVLAEMGAQSEQLRRRPTYPTQHSQPPSSYSQSQSQLKSQPSIRSAGARNVLKEMGAASDQIRARPPGSHPGRPGPRAAPKRPQRQGTFEPIVVGQLPTESDEDAEPRFHHGAMASLTGAEGLPIRRSTSPATDSSSAPESTPPEVSVLGLQLDPSALRKPVLDIDPAAIRKPALYQDEEFGGLAYDAPARIPQPVVADYDSSPSEYAGEDLIDSYFDRSPEVVTKPILPPEPSVPASSSRHKREISIDALTRSMGTMNTDVVDQHTRAFMDNRNLPTSDDGHSSTDHAMRPYGSEAGHSSQQSHMRRAYGSDLGHDSQSRTSRSASIHSRGSVTRARPEHSQTPPISMPSSYRRASSDRRDSTDKEAGLFRKASQLSRKFSTKNSRKSREHAPPLPPSSYDNTIERKSCRPTIHTSSSIAAEIRQVENKEDAAQMEALFLV